MFKTLPISVPNMDNLDIGVLTEIKDMAAGMTKEEVLQTYSISIGDLDATERTYFHEFYNYGRGMAVRTVVSNLIESTKGKAGSQAAIMFLRRFAEEFKGEEFTDASDGFSFHFGKKD